MLWSCSHHLLPKYVLEGVRDARDSEAARFTGSAEETGLLTRACLVPKKLPMRWAQQLSCEPAPMPPAWGYMFRTADFHMAQYFQVITSAAIVALRPQVLQ